MTTPNNLREFSRIHLPLMAAIHGDDTLVTSGPVQNLSLNGVLVSNHAGSCLNAGTAVSVDFFHEEEEPCLRASGQIVRCDQDWLAVRFNEMGLDDLATMRNLIRWHADNVDRVEQEFDNHVGLRKKS